MNLNNFFTGTGSLILLLMITTPVLSNSLEIHGFVSQGYLQTDRDNYMVKTEEGSFKFNEIGFNVSNDISDDLRLGIQFLSRSLGDQCENATTIDWAFADYRYHDLLGFRFGRIKIPLGLYNEIRDIDMLRTSIFLPSSIYSEPWRDTMSSLDGIGLYGYLSLNGMGGVSYQALVGQMETPEDGGVARYIERIGTNDVIHMEPSKSYNASLLWDLPIEGLSLGSSYLSNKMKVTSLFGDHFTFGDLRLLTDMNAQLPEMLNEVIYNKTQNQNMASMMSSDFINWLIPQNYQNLDNEWPKEVISDFHTLDFWVLSLKYQWGDFILSAEQLDMRMDFDYKLGDINLRASPQPWHSLGYYVSGSYTFKDWLEFGVYYSEFYDTDNDKHAESYVKKRELDTYKYPTAVLYAVSSEEIRQNFKTYANKVFAASGKTIKLSDDDVAAIKLISDYELNRIKYNEYVGWFKELVVSTSAHINEQWTLKLEGHFIDGISLMDWTVNNGDIPRKRFLFASKVTFSF